MSVDQTGAVTPDERAQMATRLADARKRVERRALIWGAVALVGGVVSLVTYVNASSSDSGGGYVVFWGAILVGVINCGRSLATRSKIDAALRNL
jgi:hypothetical protein